VSPDAGVYYAILLLRKEITGKLKKSRDFEAELLQNYAREKELNELKGQQRVQILGARHCGGIQRRSARPGGGLHRPRSRHRHSCVKLHGGMIAFESQEGHGTTFMIALPLFSPGPEGNGEGITQFLQAAFAGKNPTVI
jgi:hypothetical protein